MRQEYAIGHESSESKKKLEIAEPSLRTTHKELNTGFHLSGAGIKEEIRANRELKGNIWSFSVITNRKRLSLEK